MKKLSNLLFALSVFALIIFVSCGKDEAPPPDPLADQAELLGRVWDVTVANITYEGGVPDGDWTGFSLTISNASATGGNYSTGSTTPQGFSDVWPSSGSWTFNDDNKNEILRSDDILMDVSVTSSSLQLVFDVPETAGRTAGIAGTWSFRFTPRN